MELKTKLQELVSFMECAGRTRQYITDQAGNHPEELTEDLINWVYWDTNLPLDILPVDFDNRTIREYEIFVECPSCGAHYKKFVKTRGQKQCTFKKCERCKHRDKSIDVKFEEDRRAYEREVKRLRSLLYAEYLKTEHWQAVRKDALQRAKNRCQLCDAADRPLNVHHRSYINKGAERPCDVIVLCRPCHEKHHNI
jgi:hypothetical protein